MKNGPTDAKGASGREGAPGKSGKEGAPGASSDALGPADGPEATTQALGEEDGGAFSGFGSQPIGGHPPDDGKDPASSKDDGSGTDALGDAPADTPTATTQPISGASPVGPDDDSSGTDAPGDGPEDALEATTKAIGEEDGGAPFDFGEQPIGGTPPVKPDGDSDGTDAPGDGPEDAPEATTKAIGEEDGGAPFDFGGPPIGGQPVDGGKITGTKGDDVLTGTDGNDMILGKKGDDVVTTGQGNDTVRGGKGDDVITVTGGGDKTINGGKGNDTLQLMGLVSDYAVNNRQNGSTVYMAPDGSRIVARNIETVKFLGAINPPPENGGFTANYALAQNDLGATALDIADGQAVLFGPNGTNFTFTGVDASGLAADGPIIATGGSGTINGVETTAVPLTPFGDTVLTIGSGFNPTGTQDVDATFATGDRLDTTVSGIAAA